MTQEKKSVSCSLRLALCALLVPAEAQHRAKMSPYRLSDYGAPALTWIRAFLQGLRISATSRAKTSRSSIAMPKGNFDGTPAPWLGTGQPKG